VLVLKSGNLRVSLTTEERRKWPSKKSLSSSGTGKRALRALGRGVPKGRNLSTKGKKKTDQGEADWHAGRGKPKKNKGKEKALGGREG